MCVSLLPIGKKSPFRSLYQMKPIYKISNKNPFNSTNLSIFIKLRSEHFIWSLFLYTTSSIFTKYKSKSSNSLWNIDCKWHIKIRPPEDENVYTFMEPRGYLTKVPLQSLTLNLKITYQGLWISSNKYDTKECLKSTLVSPCSKLSNKIILTTLSDNHTLFPRICLIKFIWCQFNQNL